MKFIYPILMVGGAGTRLWPVSTKAMPKQFQKMVSEKSLFQETLLRLRGDVDNVRFAPPIIFGASDYLHLIEAQLAEIGITPTAIILEPCPRSTTPVAAISSEVISKVDKDALVMLVPSDHYIAQPDAFRKAIASAAPSAHAGWITTFGILATSPESGFGYICAGETIEGRISKITTFTEKPDTQTAQEYMQNERYTWNAGIFLFSPHTMLSELESLAPETFHASREALANATTKGNAKQLDEECFAKCRKISLDYSIMEKTQRGAVYAPLSCGWSDVGTWTAISELKPQQASDQIISYDNKNCYIQTDGSALVAATGLQDIIIVVHEGTILVLPKDRSQDVSKVVEALNTRQK